MTNVMKSVTLINVDTIWEIEDTVPLIAMKKLWEITSEMTFVRQICDILITMIEVGVLKDAILK